MFKIFAAATTAALFLPTASAQLSSFDQDFENLAPMAPDALSADGWLVFGNAFNPDGSFAFGYGPFDAPNGGPSFSSIASSAFATPRQGAQQINVFSDYNGNNQAMGLFIEANVFQEQIIDASNLNQTWTFSYDVQKAPLTANGEANTTTIAFIKVLDPNAGFALVAFPQRDTTDAPLQSFDSEQISITIDPSWTGNILQFGFASTTTAFNDTGRYYDQVRFLETFTPTSKPLPRVVYSTVANSATSDVPGLPGETFDLGSAFAFAEMSAARSDLRTLTLTAQIEALNTATDEVLIADGAVVLREGDAAPFLPSGELVGAFDNRVGVNSSGQFVFQMNTNGGPNTSDEYIFFSDGLGNFTPAAHEGDPFAPAPSATVGFTLESANIAEDGTVSYYTESVVDGGFPNDEDNFVVVGSSILIQLGVTPIGGDSAGEFLQNIDANDYIISDDGSHYIIRGDLTSNAITTAEDDCVIVDGNVLFRESRPLLGGLPTEIVDNLNGHKINNSGSYLVRGTLDTPFTDDSFVVMDGVRIARSGLPIHAGTSEVFSEISGVELNNDGDFLVVGSTDNTDPSRDSVMVLNNERVIARAGDPVDLDQNGVFDDDTFISLFDGDNMVLGDRAGGLRMLFVARLVGGPTLSTIGSAVFELELEGVVGSSICLGNVNSTGVGARTIATGSTSIADNDLTLHSCQLPVGSMGFFVTSLETNLVANPGGSEGDLCIASFVIGRYNNDVLTADADGAVSLPLDLVSTPIPSGITGISPGETRYWQLWYRDMSATGTPTSNFGEAVGITFE